MKLFITGIGTDVGKSIISSILVEAFKADYWKPIQTGDKDTDWVASLLSHQAVIHPSTYTFKIPASPHYAAANEGIQVNPELFEIPKTENHLIIEGAGGAMVPLNDSFLVIDLIEKMKLPVILVSRHYLGSINHTLLTIKALKSRNISILGIVINGNKQTASETAIESFGEIKIIESINEEPIINKEIIANYAKNFRQNLFLKTLFQ